MGLSGVVGLGIGDSGLFAAYNLIGPRRTLLVMALSPIFAAVCAYLMLGEILPSLAMIGIAITLGGVMLVILEGEKHSGELPLSRKLKTYGVSFALIGAAGQGIGTSSCEGRNLLEPSNVIESIICNVDAHDPWSILSLDGYAAWWPTG